MHKPKELERRSGSSQSLPLFLVRAEALWPRLGRDVHTYIHTCVVRPLATYDWCVSPPWWGRRPWKAASLLKNLCTHTHAYIHTYIVRQLQTTWKRTNVVIKGRFSNHSWALDVTYVCACIRVFLHSMYFNHRWLRICLTYIYTHTYTHHCHNVATNWRQNLQLISACIPIPT